MARQTEHVLQLRASTPSSNNSTAPPRRSKRHAANMHGGQSVRHCFATSRCSHGSRRNPIHQTCTWRRPFFVTMGGRRRVLFLSTARAAPRGLDHLFALQGEYLIESISKEPPSIAGHEAKLAELSRQVADAERDLRAPRRLALTRRWTARALVRPPKKSSAPLQRWSALKTAAAKWKPNWPTCVPLPPKPKPHAVRRKPKPKCSISFPKWNARPSKPSRTCTGFPL